MEEGSRFTRLSKFIAFSVFSLSLTTFCVPSTTAYLTLVPGRTLPCVWNLVTAGFVSTNPGKALAEILALLLLSRSVEPAYGSIEFLRFLLIVDVLPALITFAVTYLAYIAMPNKEGRLLYTQYSGFHGVVGGLLVAVRQVLPEHEVKLLGLVTLQARYFPTVYLLLAGILAAAVAPTALPFLLLGTYTAWFYLRFFQHQPSSELRGDASDSFRFSTFFPDALQPQLDLVGGAFARLLGLQHAPLPAGGAEDGRRLMAGGEDDVVDADASRRRQRGTKALEARLAALVPSKHQVAAVVDEELGVEAEGPEPAAKQSDAPAAAS